MGGPLRIVRRMRRALGITWVGAIGREMDTEPIELSGGTLKLLAGAWLLMPFGTFETSSVFRLVAVIPEWAWGILLIAIGIGHLMALADGSAGWRRSASLLGFLVWFTFASTFVYSNAAGLSWCAFFVLACQQGWAYIRLGQLIRFQRLQEGG